MNRQKNILLILLIGFLLLSCGGKKRTVDGVKLKNHNWKLLIDSLERNEFDYDWIRSKSSANVIFREEKNSVKVNLRIKKDSASWVNLSKGIQIMTAIASNDSIKVNMHGNDCWLYTSTDGGEKYGDATKGPFVINAKTFNPYTKKME